MHARAAWIKNRIRKKTHHPHAIKWFKMLPCMTFNLISKNKCIYAPAREFALLNYWTVYSRQSFVRQSIDLLECCKHFNGNRSRTLCRHIYGADNWLTNSRETRQFLISLSLALDETHYLNDSFPTALTAARAKWHLRFGATIRLTKERARKIP
jgi:hypothetical protein